MRTALLLLLVLLLASSCSAQILFKPDPRATSYLFFAGQPPRAVISAMTAEERAALQQAYNTVLKDNPALDAEADALSAQMDAYRKKLVEAVIKADSRLAPLLESHASSLTAEQSNEIWQTQAQVMQADPGLQTEWDALMKKMIAHQQATDAAIVKLAPGMTQVLAKLSP